MPLRESELFNEQNEEAYDQLISLIETTQGRLAPILVGCDDAKLRQRAIDRYEGEAAKAKIRAYRIVLGQEPSVRAGLMALKERETYLQAGGNAVFTVTGAEWLLRIKVNSADEQSDLDKFFGYLQWTREGLREFRYPIVIWVSQIILKEMSQRAPDFWSWRKAVLRFVDESAPSFVAMQTEPRQPASESQTDEYLLPVAELQAEIDQLTERDLQSPGLATLYERLGQVYAQRVERGEAKNLEDEREWAIAAFQEAIARYLSQNNLSAQGNVLIVLGNFLCSQSRYTEAIEFNQQSLEIAREIGDRRGEANSLANLGITYWYLGQYQRAIEFNQQSLEIAREIGDRRGESNSLNCLGYAYKSLGQYQQAIEFLQQSLEIVREIGDRREESNSLNCLGDAYKSLGQYQQAIEFLQQSLEIAREISDRRGEVDSLGYLGIAYRDLGQYPRAIEFLQQSLEIAREIGDRNWEAGSLFNMAIALAKLDRRWEALQHYEQAQQIYEALKLDYRVEQCKTALYNLGQIIPAEVIRAPQVRDESDAPTRPRKRRKTPWWVWGLVGVAIVLAIAWWLKG
jgi:tetratricopeptide (TPR) repeat protein